MRAAIFNPYLDTLGGGERYTFSFAKTLSEIGFDVFVEWKSDKILKAVEKRFGINLKDVHIVDTVNRGDGYDLCFWVSDGSIPALKARKNFLHFQVPFTNVNGRSLINKMKFFRIERVICNSLFTKQVVDKEYGVNSVTIYPPVDVKGFKPKRKENIILSVGRFSKLLQSKGHDVVIRAFKNFYDSGNKEWKLILAGGTEIGSSGYIQYLRNLSNDYPVELVESPDIKKLQELYGISKFFWAATGFKVNEASNPENVEHFGISVIEAMSSACIPFAYNAGGFKETITNGVNGFLWSSEEELIQKTKTVIADKNIYLSLVREGKLSALNYSTEVFKENVKKIL